MPKSGVEHLAAQDTGWKSKPGKSVKKNTTEKIAWAKNEVDRIPGPYQPGDASQDRRKAKPND